MGQLHNANNITDSLVSYYDFPNDEPRHWKSSAKLELDISFDQ